MTHTPTPWGRSKKSNTFIICEENGEPGGDCYGGGAITIGKWDTDTPSGFRHIALMTWNERDNGENEANAALIVRVVNCHEELVEALDCLIKYAEWEIREGRDHHPTLPSAVATARATLEKANG